MEAAPKPHSRGDLQPRLRLHFLDGIRGLAALHVLLFHIHLNVYFPDTPGWVKILETPFVYGHFPVCVFIVLSGFCLMLPVARSADQQLSGGWKGFLWRRSLRILPAYYAALIFSAAWTFVYQGAKYRAGREGDFVQAFSPGDITAHLLLVHNLFPNYWGVFNGALWSVASEWQIYFIFAFLLLPLWRRWGNLATLSVAAILGLGPHYLLPAGEIRSGADRACSWFILLFAFGLTGAALLFDPRRSDSKKVARFPWGAACLALVGVLAVVVLTWHPDDNPWAPSLLPTYTWSTDVVAGLATICLILFCARYTDESPGVPRRGEGRPFMATVLIRLLESRPARTLGQFSYTLYLIHPPIVTFVLYVITHLNLPHGTRAPLMWAVSVSVALTLSYFLSRFVETPFTSQAIPRRTPGK